MSRRQFRNLVTVLVAVICLLTGFLLGRLTAGSGSSGQESADLEEAAQEETVLAEEIPEETAQEEESVDSSLQAEEEVSEGVSSSDESELVDAADAEYDFETSSDAEVITHEAVTSVTGDLSVVDVSTIEDVTLYEAVLPDGVVSTLYGKTGKAEFQIVVFGDSQFGNYTGYDGMAYKLSQKLHANVYNLAMGGKTASVDPEEEGNTDINSWEETCGVSMVKAVCGYADGDEVFDGWDYQKNVFNSCDFSKTDLFIIEFGANDFLSEREMSNSVNPYNYYTYFGALDEMVTDLRTTFPDAYVIVCAPTYAQFWESGTGAFLGDSNIISNFYGTLYNYAQTSTNVASGHTMTITVNMYEDADIDMYSAPEDLLDGLHLTESGRDKYVTLLSRMALRALGYEIGEDVDPDDIDWVSQEVSQDTDEESAAAENADQSEMPQLPSGAGGQGPSQRRP